jgi:hypothetical protein
VPEYVCGLEGALNFDRLTARGEERRATPMLASVLGSGIPGTNGIQFDSTLD